MKLIVTGATGFVATEVIRLALQIPKITSVIALSRHEVQIPSGITNDDSVNKFRSVVVGNYLHLSDAVKKELTGADACVWTLAVTPAKSKNEDPKWVRHINYDYPITVIPQLHALRSQHDNTPFRFLYVSGFYTERDRSKVPSVVSDDTAMQEYLWTRGDVENYLFNYASANPDSMSACVAKPGIITAPGRAGPPGAVAPTMPRVAVVELAAAMLQGILEGFGSGTLTNDDLARLGKEALEQWGLA